MAWNVLSAQGEALGYTYRALESITGDSFMEKFKNEAIKRNLIFRDIISDSYLNSRNTDKKESIKTMQFLFPLENFPSRYISSKVFNIKHQMDIYNNTLAIYNWYEGEVFGVETITKRLPRCKSNFLNLYGTWLKKFSLSIQELESLFFLLFSQTIKYAPTTERIPPITVKIFKLSSRNIVPQIYVAIG